MSETAPGSRNDDALWVELQELAREVGLVGPRLSTERGGLGLDRRGAAILLKEAGYGLLGPRALNCAAPDEGNMHLLDLGANRARGGRENAGVARR